MSSAEYILDVSDREPPEPLTATLDAARALGVGEYLRMLHRRFPCLLLENLVSQGFRGEVCRGRNVACEVLIWRAGDLEAERLARMAAARLPPWQED